MSVDQATPPEGNVVEARERNIEQSAAALERFINPAADRPRGSDGKFAKPEQPAQPNAQVEGDNVPAKDAEQPAPDAPAEDAEEEIFEIGLEDGATVQLTASQLRDVVKQSRTPAPPPNIEEHVSPIRQQLEAERQQLQAERARYAQQLQQFVPQSMAQLQTEFADVKSVADLQRMATEDPARYVRFQALRDATQQAQQQLQMLHHQQQQQMQEQFTQLARKEAELLSRAVPEFADPAKAPAEKKALRDFLVKSGFSDGELENLVDHRTVVVARKAMLYDALMAAKPQAKKVVPMVRTIKPGSTQPKAAPATAQREQAVDRLKKEQTVDALADAFRTMGFR